MLPSNLSGFSDTICLEVKLLWITDYGYSNNRLNIAKVFICNLNVWKVTQPGIKQEFSIGKPLIFPLCIMQTQYILKSKYDKKKHVPKRQWKL